MANQSQGTNPKVIILIGLPASGKSTWAKEYLQKNENTVRVNRDDFRFMLKNQAVVEPHLEIMITELQQTVIIKALMRRQNVIIDNTHLKAKTIRAMVELVQFHADVEFLLFDVPAEKCIERDKLREKKVGERIILKMNDDFLHLKETFVFQNVPRRPVYEDVFTPYPHNPELPDAVAFDLDGTLAIMGKRDAYSWDRVDIDDPNEIVIEQVDFHRNKGRKIILISGRSDEAREKTEYWLQYYGIAYDALYMRPPKDFRRDSVIKQEIFTQHIKDQYNLLCVYDDRLQVVKKWYELGIFVFNVNQGNKEF
ncbi:MAG: AAA family ATPase [Bacteroidia bacterium]